MSLELGYLLLYELHLRAGNGHHSYPEIKHSNLATTHHNEGPTNLMLRGRTKPKTLQLPTPLSNI